MKFKKEGVLANSTASVEFGIKDDNTGHVWIGNIGTFTKAECDIFNGTKKSPKKAAKKADVKKATSILSKIKDKVLKKKK